jgi:hypothetical protein
MTCFKVLSHSTWKDSEKPWKPQDIWLLAQELNVGVTEWETEVLTIQPVSSLTQVFCLFMVCNSTC